MSFHSRSVVCVCARARTYHQVCMCISDGENGRRTVFERSDALKGDAETIGIGETRWVVEELDVLLGSSAVCVASSTIGEKKGQTDSNGDDGHDRDGRSVPRSCDENSTANPAQL